MVITALSSLVCTVSLAATAGALVVAVAELRADTARLATS